MGSIEIIAGCMFSGKTEELLRRLKRATIAKQTVAIFKPNTDARWEGVRTRDGRAIYACCISDPKEILECGPDVKVIGIDEGQFFDVSLAPIVATLAKQGRRVIVAGLDLDFMGQPFPTMAQLLALGTHIHKVTAVCTLCGAEATRSQRLAGGINVVQLGDTEYEARCLRCFDPITT